VDIESYGQAKFEWLKQFLELANGIPNHDTFARVLVRFFKEKSSQLTEKLDDILMIRLWIKALFIW
jgi:hypothetical protein